MSKLLKRLEKLRGISLLATALARLKSRPTRVQVFRRMHLRFATGALRGPGRLLVGRGWPGVPILPGYLVIHRGGACTVNGQFSIYNGCRADIQAGGELVLGSGYANSGLRLYCRKRIEIGEGVMIAQNVTIYDSDAHEISGGRGVTLPVRIGDHVWIGLSAIILKGVTIGDGAVVAAGAVVTRDVPPGTLVAGNPARVIREVTWR